MSSPISFSSPMDGESSFSYFPPSAGTGYSSDDGDILKTPPLSECIDRDVFPHLFDFDQGFTPKSGFFNGQSHDQFGSKPMDGLYFPASPISRQRAPSLTSQGSPPSHPPPSIPPLSLGLDSTVVRESLDSIEIDPFDTAFAAVNEERATHAPLLVQTSFMEACRYSSRFPNHHLLNSSFVRAYELGDELGSGGYGFVMTAYNRAVGQEVAVKFIIKNKVSEHAWTEDDVFGKLPMEVMLLSLVDHENIVKCLDLFEDELYFYLVQELHGSPWKKLLDVLPSQTKPLVVENLSSPPFLSPSCSEDSIMDFGPTTPPRSSDLLILDSPSHIQIQGIGTPLYHAPNQKCESQSHDQLSQNQSPVHHFRPPQFARRPSHDLFECIEQTPDKRLSEDQARYIFGQVVEAAYYLDSQGITHRDIKDENLVIDQDLKVKLIDFGSAIIADPAQPRPFYKLFFGTTAYASSEILRKHPYQAPAAEVWTLGVLLSYLLTGMSPFPTEKDAIEGRIMLAEIRGEKLSRACLNLMRRCLEPDPQRRADIKEVRAHRWLKQTSSR